MLNKNGREKTKTTGEKERNGEGGQRKKISSETISLNDKNEKGAIPVILIRKNYVFTHKKEIRRGVKIPPLNTDGFTPRGTSVGNNVNDH